MPLINERTIHRLLEEEDVDLEEQEDDTWNAMTCTTIVNNMCCN
jgi:hypothetical protein